jgi:hypothetical protein
MIADAQSVWIVVLALLVLVLGSVVAYVIHELWGWWKQ